MREGNPADDVPDRVDRGTAEVIANYVMGLMGDVEAGRMTPEAARDYADNATRYASDSVKGYATAAINARLSRPHEGDPQDRSETHTSTRGVWAKTNNQQ